MACDYTHIAFFSIELDPEADVVPDDSDENSSADESADEKAGREHYVSVGYETNISSHDSINCAPYIC